MIPSRRPTLARTLGFVVLLGAVSWALGAFAAWPWTASAPDAAVVRVSLKHVSGFSETRRPRTHEEEEALEKLPRHMRPIDPSRPTTARRAESTLTVSIDGRPVLARTYRPTGLRHDGPVYGYEEVSVAPGAHEVTVTLTDRAPGARPLTLRRALRLTPGAAPLLEYGDAAGWR
jgi:hypothetical protein